MRVRDSVSDVSCQERRRAAEMLAARTDRQLLVVRHADPRALRGVLQRGLEPRRASMRQVALGSNRHEGDLSGSPSTLDRNTRSSVRSPGTTDEEHAPRRRGAGRLHFGMFIVKARGAKTSSRTTRNGHGTSACAGLDRLRRARREGRSVSPRRSFITSPPASPAMRRPPRGGARTATGECPLRTCRRWVFARRGRRLRREPDAPPSRGDRCAGSSARRRR